MLEPVKRHYNKENFCLIASLLQDIKVFPFFGTLLGITREKNIIKNDDDIDFYVDVKNREKLLDIMSNSPFTLTDHNHAHFLQVSRLVDTTQTYVDFYLYENSNKLSYINDRWNFLGTQDDAETAIHIPKDIIFPLTYKKVFGVKVCMPAAPKKCCEFLYGAGWQVPRRKGSEYSVSIEGNRPKISISTLINTNDERIDFVDKPKRKKISEVKIAKYLVRELLELVQKSDPVQKTSLILDGFIQENFEIDQSDISINSELKDGELLQLKELLATSELRNQTANKELELRQQEFKALQSDNDHLSLQLKDLGQKLIDVERELKDWQSKQLQAESQLDAKVKELTEMSGKLHFVETENLNIIEGQKTELQQITERLAASELQNQNTNTALQLSQQSLNVLETENCNLLRQFEDSSQKLTNLEIKLGEYQTREAQTDILLNKNSADLHEKDENIQQLQAIILTMQHEVAAAKAEASLLREELLKTSYLFDPLLKDTAQSTAINNVLMSRKLRQEVARLKKAKFDENAYLALYPDVKTSNMNATFHYALYGRREARKASFL